MTFTNSILAGEELVRTAIRSANYVPGVSGWRIARDGSFEGNNGTFRGELLVTGPNGTIRIYNDPSNGAVIDLLAGGHHWQLYAFSLGNQKSLVINDANSGGNAGLGFSYDVGSGQSAIVVAADDFYDAGPWQAASLAGGWSNTGGVYAQTSYRKRGRGVEVVIEANGPVGLPANVFTLPAGYRPALGGMSFVITGDGGHGNVEVSTAGVVRLLSVVSGGTNKIAGTFTIPIG